MLATLRKFFEESCCLRGNDASTPDNSRAVHLTAAALLLEMVRADQQADDREHDAVVDALQKVWNIPEEDLGRVVALAAKQTTQATDLYDFTKLVNEHYSPAQKKTLIESLWEVAFADGVLHHYEEHLVRKVAELIYVPHKDFIQSKHQVQERLGIV